MPSKLRKAIGTMKDQTSISIAKVSNKNASSLEVLILKATRHDEAPIDERYVNEILTQISSSKVYAAGCARAIAKRISKTRNWIVALKSLMLVLRIFQDGDPYFPKEVLHCMKRGAKILNLASFRDDSNSSPWEYTAFIRTFALYLDERLDCFVTGKLQRRFTNKGQESRHRRSRNGSDSINDLKPAMLLSKISSWQKLLDRAIATKPTGTAKTNGLVRVSFYAVVRESFDLYRDISDGLALLLDGFFQLPYQSCVSAFQICLKATKQVEDLSSFYDFCTSMGVGRTSEYPSVQKISEELVETLQEFLKDQSCFPNVGKSAMHLLLTAPPTDDPSSSADRCEACDQFSEPPGRFSDFRDSEFDGYQGTFEDLMSVADVMSSPCKSMDPYLEQFENEKQSQMEDAASGTDSGSAKSMPNSALDLLSLDLWPEDPKQEQEQHTPGMETTGQSVCWELVLAEAASQPTQASSNAAIEPDLSPGNGFQTGFSNNMFDQSPQLEQHYNPFLSDLSEIPAIPTPTNDQTSFAIDNMFAITPTFHAAPTFSAQSPEQNVAWHDKDELFGPSSTTSKEFGNSLEDLFSPNTNQETPCSTMNTTSNGFGNSLDDLFLQIPNQKTPAAVQSPVNDMFAMSPTFHASPTFRAQNPGMGLQNQHDPFSPFPAMQTSNVQMDQNSLLHQQQLWMQHQDKIIAKNMI